MANKYRVIVGEKGNEQGHIVETSAQSEAGARRVLSREMRAYGSAGQSWGWVEVCLGGEWMRVED